MQIQLVDFINSKVITDNHSRQATEHIRVTKSVQSFMKHVFHEVRVPLNSLSLGMNFIKPASHEEEEALLIMKESTAFMSNTLNDVLSMAKIEEGGMTLSVELFDSREMFSRSLLVVQGHAISKQIALNLILPDSFPTHLDGDRFKLEHVFSNLLSNAIKFSPQKSTIIVDCSSKEVDAERSAITIDVIDEGVGMSSENVKLLFTPFMQFNANEIQRGQGTGILSPRRRLLLVFFSYCHCCRPRSLSCKING